MGKIEEKIKNEIFQEIFSDTLRIFEFINARFELDERQQDAVIKKLHRCNSELTELLKQSKLS